MVPIKCFHDKCPTSLQMLLYHLLSGRFSDDRLFQDVAAPFLKWDNSLINAAMFQVDNEWNGTSGSHGWNNECIIALWCRMTTWKYPNFVDCWRIMYYSRFLTLTSKVIGSRLGAHISHWFTTYHCVTSKVICSAFNLKNNWNRHFSGTLLANCSSSADSNNVP